MKFFFVVVKKELLEIIRDKSSLILSLVLMLIVPFAIIGYGFQQNNIDNVAISENARDMEAFCQSFKIPYEIVEDTEVVSAIQEGNASLGIKFEKDKYHVIFDETSKTSLSILNKLNNFVKLTINNDEMGNEKIVYEGISLYSDNYEIFSMMLPILFVFSVLTGSGNGIAFNIFTGEKEKGSFEALLLTKIKRSVLFFAKLSVVALVMLFTSVIYLLAILLSIKIGNVTGILFMKSSKTLFLIICTLVTFSVFAASYISVIALNAKSIREAQLSTMLLSLLFCGAGIGVNFGNFNSGIVAVVPVVNTMQSLNYLFNGNLDILLICGTNIVNVIGVLLNIKLGTNIINRD